ncbi:unnamed protein product [Pylaiella littoralis]
MSWAAVMLVGSGLVFSTGLIWFFVQAWIFAIQARTVWLIILLTVTTAVAILSQGYLCTIFVSIPPTGETNDLVVLLMSLREYEGNYRIVSYEPKPRGVTQVNREAFASFPFDATASLVRRKGSDTRPSIGWEVKSAQQLAESVDYHRHCHHHSGGGGAASSTAAVGGDAIGDDGDEDDDDCRSSLRSGGGKIEPLSPFCVKVANIDTESQATPVAVPSAAAPAAAPAQGVCSEKNRETLHLLAPSAGSGGVISGGEWGEFVKARIASSYVRAAAAAAAAASAANHYVEDVVESGCAETFVLEGRKSERPPVGTPEQAEREIEEDERSTRLEEGVLRGPLDDSGSSGTVDFGRRQQPQCRRQRHHRRSPRQHLLLHQEMKSCFGWRASGRTDATMALGSDLDDDNDDDSDDDDEPRIGAAKGGGGGGGGQASESRSRCATVGSGTDGCSETAVIGHRACAGGEELLTLEQEQHLWTKQEAAEVLPSSPEQKSVPGVSGVGAGAGVDVGVGVGVGGNGRLSDEPIVRVSELPDVCAICLGQYVNGEEVHVLPCLHIFHAQCLDIWIVGHQSCPYCKGDLNVLPPPESNSPAAGASAATAAAAYTCSSVLSGLVCLVTRPFAQFREYRERRRRGGGGGGEEGGGEDESGDSADELTSPPPGTPAMYPTVLPMVVA